MGTQLKPDLSNLENPADATPHYYGDNFPNSELSSFDYSRHVLDLGGSVIYELWALPSWATVPWNGPHATDTWNKPIKQVANPDEYARLIVTYCKKAQAATGTKSSSPSLPPSPAPTAALNGLRTNRLILIGPVRRQPESISMGIVRLRSSTVYVRSTRNLLHNVSWSTSNGIIQEIAHASGRRGHSVLGCHAHGTCPPNSLKSWQTVCNCSRSS